jgi:stringent starvation protein B
MVPIKPYLLRAAYEWSLDCGFTPHILVQATVSGVVVPEEYVEEGRIVLNVHPDATSNLQIGDALVEFSARFSGRPFAVRIPLAAILGLYARENGEGVSFPAENLEPTEVESGGDDATSAKKDRPAPSGKPDLKLIK